jgi:mediator of RNA polymerase II transcription subunit 23
MGKLMESIYGDNKHTTLLPGNIVACAPTQPLPMNLLDSLTVHAKMRYFFLTIIMNLD